MISLATPAETARLASFRLGAEWYGIDVLKVQEVLMQQPLTAVPRSPHYIRGLINVRGLIISSISLKDLLAFECCDYQDEHYNIIVPSNDGTVCLTVDEIGDVIPVSADTRTDHPPTLSAACARFIQGVYRLPDLLIIELNVDTLCSAD